MQKGIREKPLKTVLRFIAPMRPKMVADLPEDRHRWLLEPKLDGYRVVGVKDSGRTTIYSMDNKIYNQEFPAIYDAFSALFAKQVVVDGEIVAVEPTGRPNFNALQNRNSTKLPIFITPSIACTGKVGTSSTRQLKSARNIWPNWRKTLWTPSSPYSSLAQR
jgi:ATP-dependent DNA ligase